MFCPENVQFCMGILKNKTSRNGGCLEDNSCVFAINAVRHETNRIKWTLLFPVNPYNLTQVNYRAIFTITNEVKIANETREAISVCVVNGVLDVTSSFSVQARLFSRPSISEVSDQIGLTDIQVLHQHKLRYVTFNSPVVLSCMSCQIIKCLILQKSVIIILTQIRERIIWTKIKHFHTRCITVSLRLLRIERLPKMVVRETGCQHR